MKNIKLKIPDCPGVYFFKKGRKILYIGKATSLKDRVKSYFNSQTVNSRGPVIAKMVESATAVTFKKTDSVLEAIILEANLIKKHQPRFNSREKDNKSFCYAVVTKEKFPRVLQIRKRNLYAPKNDFIVDKLFGPFPSAGVLQEALRVIRKILPFRDRCKVGSNKPCFNFQLGLCPGVCVGAISEASYKAQIKNIKLLFSGKKLAAVRELKKQMNDLSSLQKFEEANIIKKKIFSLEHIQDVSLMKRDSLEQENFKIEAYDVAHQSGGHNVGVMAVIENGEASKGEYRKFKIRGNFGGDDLRSLREILDRRFNHPEWRLPDLIVIDGGKLQLNVAKEIMARDGLTIPIVSVVKDLRHRPKTILGDRHLVGKYSAQILLANSEAHNFAIKYFRILANKVK